MIYFISGIILIAIILGIIKSKFSILKIVNIILLIIIFVVIIYYLVDFFNIPTKYNLIKNINSARFFEFISNLIIAIIGTIIGGLTTIWITMYQIKENVRLQNMPLIKYSIDTIYKGKSDINDLIDTNISTENIKKNSKTYGININMNNIGMNCIRNLKVYLNSDFLKNDKYVEISNDTVNIIPKGESLDINKFFSLQCINKKYNLKIVVFYEDILFNCYMQEIDLNYWTTKISNGIKYNSYIEDCKISKECLIKEKFENIEKLINV